MKSFLIVDDDDAILRLHETLIASKYGNVLVERALNGREALEKARRLDYTVILTDLNMPVMTGAELYKKLKKERPHLAGRLAVISGNPENDEDISFLRGEGCPLLTKPARIADFYGLIKAILNAEIERFEREYGYRCMRKSVRFRSGEKCGVKSLSSDFTPSTSVIADTVDYSEKGLAMSYEGQYIPPGSEVATTVYSLDIEDKIGKVVWSRSSGSGFRSGLEWL